MTVLVIAHYAADKTLGMDETIAKYTTRGRHVRFPLDVRVIKTLERMVTTSSGWIDGRART